MSNTIMAVLSMLVLISPFLMMGVWVFVAWRYLDGVEAILANSRMVALNREIYAHTGWPGKVMRVGSISVMLSMKSFSVRKGLLDSEDASRVPVGLQRYMLGLWAVQTLQIAVIVLFYVWIKDWK